MIKLGLTGSIGMGKSTVLNMFASEGIPTINSDIIVSDLYSDNNEGVQIISQLSPQCIVNNNVDRDYLSKKVLSDNKLLKKIESKIHPLVQMKQREFIEHNLKIGSWLVVIEVPLLFETGAEKNFDYTLVVSCKKAEQNSRIALRKTMSKEKFELISSRQICDDKKLKLADFTINTSKTIVKTHEEVRQLIYHLKNLQTGN